VELKKIEEELKDVLNNYERAARILEEVNKKAIRGEEDIELKNARIQSLNKELNEREEELVRNLQIQQKYEDEKTKLYTENCKLAADLEVLRRDLEFTEGIVFNLKSDNKELKDKLQECERSIENTKIKEELLTYYKEKVNKCDEIMKQQVNLNIHLIDRRNKAEGFRE